MLTTPRTKCLSPFESCNTPQKHSSESFSGIWTRKGGNKQLHCFQRKREETQAEEWAGVGGWDARLHGL